MTDDFQKIMGINVAIDWTIGERVKIVLDPHKVVERFLPSPDDTSSSCLRFIDRYGDAIFNRLQIPVFLQEWEGVSIRAQTAEEREMWQQIKKLALECASQPHYHLKFIGD